MGTGCEGSAQVLRGSQHRVWKALVLVLAGLGASTEKYKLGHGKFMPAAQNVHEGKHGGTQCVHRGAYGGTWLGLANSICVAGALYRRTGTQGVHGGAQGGHGGAGQTQRSTTSTSQALHIIQGTMHCASSMFLEAHCKPIQSMTQSTHAPACTRSPDDAEAGTPEGLCAQAARQMSRALEKLPVTHSASPSDCAGRQEADGMKACVWDIDFGRASWTYINKGPYG
eukprot:scaffold310417_cov24-Tisochrysis_lutea.AAC.1